LTSEKDNTDKVVKYIDEVKRMKIELSPPDINHSQLEFSAINQNGKDIILFGLGAIKGVGEAAVKSILEVRKEGEFKTLEDFVNRIDSSKVNKRVIESITKSGGFDCYHFSRHAILEQIETIIDIAKKASDAKKNVIGSLFGDDDEITKIELKLNNSPEFELKEILNFEKDTLGFYVSGHPLDSFRAEMDSISYALSSDIEQIADGSYAIFIGKVEDIVQKVSKKGNTFGLVTLMDFHGDIEIMLFADKLEQLKEMNLEEPVAFKVKITKTEMFTRMGVTKIMTLKEVKKESKKFETKKVEEPQLPLCIKLPLDIEDSTRVELLQLINKHRGNRELQITFTSKLQDIKIESSIRVNSTLEEALKSLEFVDVI
ncbi:MAG: DNA polymerase III subunit alpha, partial [Campylobacterota bacterium]|nr:DNA polymerase III subunit alpha [Campylobacterota bacterium]